MELIRLAYPRESHPGRTQNIGSNGLLLDTSTELEVGEVVECRIAWPASAGAKPVVLRYFGRVVRRIASDQPNGYLFAIALDRYEFQRPGAADPSSTPAVAAAASA